MSDKVLFTGNNRGEVAIEDINNIWIKAAELSKNTWIGFEFGKTIQLDDLGLFGMMMKHQRNLHECLLIIDKHLSTLSKLLVIKYSFSDNHFTIKVKCKSEAREPLVFENQLMLLVLGVLVAQYKELHGKEMKFHCLSLPNSIGEVQQGIYSNFEKVLVHKREDLIIHGHLDDLLQPIVNSQADFGFSLLNTLEKSKAGGSTWSEKVAGYVMSRKNGFRPKIEEVAEQFLISKRSLQRYLKKEDVSYHTLIMNISMSEAKKMLAEGMLVKEVALAIGYSDSYTFSKAFKKYFGHSPSKKEFLLDW